MAQRRQKASSKLRSRSPRESVESLRRALKREGEERKQALERERATSEILKVIAASPSHVQPVFDAIARSAVKLCGGMFGGVFRYDGVLAHFAAHHGFSREALKLMRGRYPMKPEGLIAPALLKRTVVQSPDVQNDRRSRHPGLARVLGFRGFLAVPMMLKGEPIGAIVVFRRQAGIFADAQVTVLRTFADQAVIAIENARLFNETKEALERQTATSEILRVISGSPSDTAPVFEAILKSASELCGAHFGNLNLRDGEGFRTVAQRGANAEFAKHVSERGEALRAIRRAVIGENASDLDAQAPVVSRNHT